MKTLLISINAKYIHTNNAVRLLKANCDFDVDILEYTIKDPIHKIIQDIHEYNPDLLGFSCYIWNISIIEKILFNMKELQSKIVLGGPEVSYDSLHFMNKLDIDYIISGEGETAFNCLLKALRSNSSVTDIPNLTFRESNEIKMNHIEEIVDLNSLKLPYFFEEDKEHIPNKIAYIESSRGCPYKCSYCLSSLEKTVRFFDIKTVKESILYLMDHGAKTIKFLDRTFNANKNTMDLLQFIIDNNNSKTVFQFEITGDILDPRIIEYLNDNAPQGLFRFEIGIQSINHVTNILVDRKQDNKKLFRNIKRIQQGGIIDLHLDLIAGLPKENLESFKHTFDRVFFLGAKELQLGFLKMLRGTKIRREASKYHYRYDTEAPYEIIENEDLSIKDIEKIHLVEHMLEIYHNKGYFGIEMHQFLLDTVSPFDMLLLLGMYYKREGYKMHGYQIEDVYKIFLELAPYDEKHRFYKDYLLRSKIKPKTFFEVIKDKSLRKEILEKLSIKENIPVHKLYKHTVIIPYDEQYLIAYYQDYKAKEYYIQKTD